MLITNDELNNLRQAIESLSGLDPELQKRCGQLMFHGSYDDAVRNAFVVLEERLKQHVKKEARMTGIQRVQYGFGKEGPLTKQLGLGDEARESSLALFESAFAIYRNPLAHGPVGHGTAEAKSILGLVNLLLIILGRVVIGDCNFSPNVVKALAQVKQTLGTSVERQLCRFLKNCEKAGLHISTNTKQWIPVRQHVWAKLDHWPKAKSHMIPLFYFLTGDTPMLLFPVKYYYRRVVGLDWRKIEQDLEQLGLTVKVVNAEPYQAVNLKLQNDEQYMESLFVGVKRISEAFERSMQEGRKGT
jgi:hypothetical protein